MADEIEGMAALRGELARMRNVIENPEPVLAKVGVIALDSFKRHIELGGPGWAPNKTGTPLLRKTGRLFNSFTANSDGNVLSVSGNTVEAGTNVFYAPYLQFGTERHERGSPLAGRQGPRQYRTGAIPARVFVDIDEKTATLIRNAFAQAIMGSQNADH